MIILGEVLRISNYVFEKDNPRFENIIFHSMVDKIPQWPTIMKLEHLSQKMASQATNRSMFSHEIVLDYESLTELETIKKKLIDDNFQFFVWKTGSRGFHIHIYFLELDNFPLEKRNIIRKEFIRGNHKPKKRRNYSDDFYQGGPPGNY